MRETIGQEIKWAVFMISAVLALSACGRTDGRPSNDGINIAGEDSAGQSESGDRTGASGQPETGNPPSQEGQFKSFSWKDSHRTLAASLEAGILKENVLYGFYTDEKGVTVISQDVQSGEVLGEATITEADYARSLTADGQGNVYVLGKTGEADGFWKIDNRGQISAMPDFVLEDLDPTFWNPVQGFFADEQGNFYLWIETFVPARVFYEDEKEDVYTVADRIYVKDSQGKTLYYIQIPDSQENKLLQFFIDTDGTPGILAKDSEGIYLQELREEQTDGAPRKRLEMSGEAEGLGEPENPATVSAGAEEILFCRGSGLYRYDLKKQTTEKLLELSSCGIRPSGILYLGKKRDGIEILDNYGEGSNSEYTLLEPGESEKTVLTLGTVSLFSPLEDAVTHFNRFHDDLRVEMVNYYEEQEGYDAGVQRLKLDIIRGQAPDILDISAVDYEILAEKGILADLYPFMDKDPECGRAHMVQGILENYETDGCLYGIAPSFQLYSMWGAAEVIKGRQGVSWQELEEILRDNGRDESAVYGFSADEPVLTTLCTLGMSRFIDWEKGSCDFQGESFRQLLEFAGEYRGDPGEGTFLEKIEDGRILMTVGIISQVADYRLQREMYGGAIEFIGCPTEAGTGTAVSFTGSELAINARSGNPEGAWEFIRYYVLNQDFGGGWIQNGFPLVQKNFDRAMNRAMERNYVFDQETGEQCAVPVIVYQDPNRFNGPDRSICIYEASREDVDAVKELIGKADGRFRYYPEIQRIINEEAQAYFTGQKSLDAVTELIQNRVELYLQEQMN